MKDQSSMFKQSIEIGGKTLEFEVGRFAEQANAAVLGRFGDTMILATVVCGQSRADLGYFPLFVEYQEKLYAGGRIKGSRWVKREGRPSDDAILNARLVDRSIRPLFPKDFMQETQVIITVLSVDAENDPDMLAINTVAAALAISDIPWDGPIAAVRLGFIPGEKSSQENNNADSQAKQEQDGQEKAQESRSKEKEREVKHVTKEGYFIVNPTYVEREYSDIDLMVSATRDAVAMVEAGANEITEKTFVNALGIAQEEIKAVITAIDQLVKKVGKKKQTPLVVQKDPELQKIVKKESQEILKIFDAPKTGEKNDLDIAGISQAILEKNPQLNKLQVQETLFDLMKERIRQTILKKRVRPDGRKPDEIRKISIDVGVLPRTHGSAMFKRGATQALTITTLAAPSLEQWFETMEGEGTKRFMHHYYMPPFSVGEVGRLGWPSRREIGHGALAERALEPMIPSVDEFPYTIRVVSEILSSNGSTSMASVCGSTLSLMDSGVPLKKPVAGIAMGLVVKQDKEKEGSEYAILSDIQGLEDHVGDMDFKVAGTQDGITAIQMDVKIKGVTKDVLEEALEQARQGRIYILEKMLTTLPAPRAQLSKFAPKVEVIKIAKEQIGEVIGPGGKIIRQIIAETGAEVDVDDEGRVTISGTDQEGIRKAAEWIKGITHKVQVGEEYEGTVKRIEPYGVFVEILPGKDGLIHVSRLSNQYVEDPNQIVSLGNKLKVVVFEIDNMGRINLSIPGVQRTAQPRWEKDSKDGKGFRPRRNPHKR
jgi:polyribonucleotide nucleotidyltransferase